MPPETIATSRVKATLYVAICAAFALIGLWLVISDGAPPVAAWGCVLLFGLGALVLGYNLVRPTQLRLDGEGFVVDPGYGARPKTLWRDIGPFYTASIRRSGVMIVFQYAEGRAPRGVFNNLGGLPSGWPGSQTALVARLNAYRERALAG